MGRLTAWIASRRQSRRSARAQQDKSAGTAARPLGFERYEERIALSTNAALNFDFAENFYATTVDVSEGGWIEYRASVAGPSFFNWSDSFTHVLVTSGSGHIARLGFASLDDSTSVDLLWSEPTTRGFDYSLAGDADSPELLATDSKVVPIPPPSSAPSGNEGGQISMTPFMGPATLGLPSSGDSLYASKDRPALRPESVEATTDVPSSTPADSLRGRAVVYEVAHADSRLNGDGHRLDESLAKLEQNETGDAAHPFDLASRHHTSTIADSRAPASQVKLPAEDHGNALHQVYRDDASAMLMAETAVRSKETAEAEVADAAPAAAHETAAQDAAFEQWQNELTPALEGREVAAATVDTQQRRVLGAALFVLGAIPVTKAMRRHAQQDSVAHRPRERRPAPPSTRE
jgi:hypothetical protein